MGTGIDLEAYCARIGYDGPHTATLDTLRALHLLHPQAIPFENLDPLRGAEVPLGPATLEHKLVHGGRGGWCFEQNHLFLYVLEALGFSVTCLAARVLWGARPGVVPMRGHMLLRVDLPEGAYIADVGFGGLTLTAPIRLLLDVEQPTPHERFRLRSAASGLVLEAEVASSWQPMYRFDLQEQHPSDYRMASWYLAHLPDSGFVTGLMAARVRPDRRYALRNSEFAVHHLGAPSERWTLESADDLRRALEGPFGIVLPDDPALQRALERLTAGAAASTARPAEAPTATPQQSHEAATPAG